MARHGDARNPAPETATEPRSSGPAADIFSLGVVLHELLTGRVPGPGDRFLVMNSRGHRAIIYRSTGGAAYRYWPTAGDPLEYLPVIAALRRQGELDAALADSGAALISLACAAGIAA